MVIHDVDAAYQLRKTHVELNTTRGSHGSARNQANIYCTDMYQYELA